MKDLSFVYILSNERSTVLYIGVTANLKKRVWEHKNGQGSTFTSKYNVHKLVYYETFESIDNAIKREKQIKSGSRKKKESLIVSQNEKWTDIFDTII